MSEFEDTPVPPLRPLSEQDIRIALARLEAQLLESNLRRCRVCGCT